MQHMYPEEILPADAKAPNADFRKEVKHFKKKMVIPIAKENDNSNWHRVLLVIKLEWELLDLEYKEEAFKHCCILG